MQPRECAFFPAEVLTKQAYGLLIRQSREDLPVNSSNLVQLGLADMTASVRKLMLGDFAPRLPAPPSEAAYNPMYIYIYVYMYICIYCYTYIYMCMILYCIILSYIILYCTVLYIHILYHIISYYVILYHIISYYIILYHIISYYIIL